MKKNRYIKSIVRYFFHHEVSDELHRRVYHRMLTPVQDPERDEALMQIWEEQSEALCSEATVEKALRHVEAALPSQVVPADKNSRWSHCMRQAAVWVIPFVLFGASLCYYFSARDIMQRTLAEVTYVQHYAPLGTHEEVLLSDGTRVYLNAGSLLVYPSTFVSETRSVFLAGEAYFEVCKDKEHPFVVSTNYLNLKVLGTTFNVSAYPEDTQVSATLETGSLQVMVKSRPEAYLLQPDDQLIYTPATDQVVQQRVTASLHTDWRKGGLLFADASFADVLRNLERVYGVTFHVQTSVYQQQRLRVHLDRGESLEQALRIIKLLLPGLEYEIEGKEVYLK